MITSIDQFRLLRIQNGTIVLTQGRFRSIAIVHHGRERDIIIVTRHGFTDILGIKIDTAEHATDGTFVAEGRLIDGPASGTFPPERTVIAFVKTRHGQMDRFLFQQRALGEGGTIRRGTSGSRGLSGTAAFVGIKDAGGLSR